MGEPIPYLFFPHTGIVSVVVGMAGGQMVEAGMVGRNCVLGAAAPLDGTVALNQGLIQVSSEGFLAEILIMSTCSRAKRFAHSS